MVDATISRVRLRDLAGLGREQPVAPGGAGPATDDLMASTI
jgi:hypothetical protein